VKEVSKDRMTELLEELVKWTKVTSIPKVKELLLEVLASPEEKAAYQSSDGKKSVRELARQVNMGSVTIARWWKKWMKAGIAEPLSVKGGKRAVRSFSLEDFDIEIPELEKDEKPVDEEEEREVETT